MARYSWFGHCLRGLPDTLGGTLFKSLVQMVRSTYFALAVAGLFLGLLFAIKTELIVPAFFTETTAVSSICMASDAGLVVYAGILFMGLRMGLKAIAKRRISAVLLGLALILIGFAHGAHLVVRRGDRIRAQILVWPYQSMAYDAHTSELNYSGYDAAFHFDPQYECYEYCESFFLRRYQVGAGQQFVVYRGLLPFLGLSDDHWWPQSDE